VSHVQARHHDVQLPAVSSASAPRRIVPASRRFHIVETSLICHLTAPSRTMPAIQNLLLMGFLCSWSIGLKFPSGQLVRSGYWLEQFLAISEDVSIYDTLMHPAQWKFHDDVLYKSTFSSLLSVSPS